jgi:hypothetical protein
MVISRGLGREVSAVAKHCPVTGRPVLDCDCGACDEDALEMRDDAEDDCGDAA